MTEPKGSDPGDPTGTTEPTPPADASPGESARGSGSSDVPPASQAPSEAPSSRSDRQGIIVFFGVLALILLFVGAVAAGLGGDDRSRQERVGADRGSPFGDQWWLDPEQRRLVREAMRERREALREQRRAEREQRQAERRLQREQAHGRGGGEAEVPVTQETGTVATRQASDGTTEYVLETAAGPLVLDAGPPWFWGDTHPLAPFVGQTVTVSGVADADAQAFAVYAVGDTVLRGSGRPPWAGGQKSGAHHPPVAPASPSPSLAPASPAP